MIALRPVDEADFEVLYEHQADPEFAAMAVFQSRDREAFVAHQRRVLANPDTVNRAVEVDGELCGSLGSWLDGDMRLVGYGFGRKFWGRGIASAALRLFVDEVIADRPLHAYVATSNYGSIRVLEKAGFVPAREPEVGHDGVEERLYILG